MPRLTSTFVRRARLTSVLDAAETRQTVLVGAPAGYGKTLLLAQWAASRPDHTAWVSLDGSDNVDRHFWAALLTALAACPALQPVDALRSMPLPAAPSHDPPFLAAVIDAVASACVPVTLVLDDVHALVHPDPVHGLASLARDRPPNLQLVLASRSDPPLRLERLRLTGRLVELRAPALAFSRDETSALLVASDVAIRTEQVELLHAETEGWAAGLRLAALALRRSADPDLVLRDLVGHSRALSDYLTSEIVSGLPDGAREVLTAVSICDRVTAPLAVTLSGREEAGDVLADVERATSLVVSHGTGRRWFHVHPLLRAQLRADLQRRRPDRLALLHGRAARDRDAADDAVDALRHAALAQDIGLLANLLHTHGSALAASGQHAAVLAALEALPQARLSGDVLLVLVAALAHLEVGHLAATDRLLKQADASWPADAGPTLTALRATVGAERGWLGTTWADIPTAGTAAAGGQGDGKLTADGATVAQMLLRVNAAVAAGQLSTAEAVARAAVAEAASQGSAYLEARSTVTLAVLVSLRGDITGSLALARRAATLAPAAEWRGTVADGYGCFLQGYAALLQARPGDCLRWTTAVDGVDAVAPATTGTEMASVIPVLGLLRAAARFDLGAHRSALASMTSARLGLKQGRVLDRPMGAFVAVVEHAAAAALGMRAHAREVADWAKDRVGTTGDVLVMQAWGPAAIGRDDAARDRLRPVLDGSMPCVVPWMLLEAHLLDCRVALRSGAVSRARHALHRAVELAGETGVVRPLVTAPEGVESLLTRGLGHHGSHEGLVREVLALRAARVHVLPGTPLTGRERDVLELLPTLLSLDEIAHTLSISINTVRSHVRSLHDKLGVTSRAEAVVAARRNGLIPSGVG